MTQIVAFPGFAVGLPLAVLFGSLVVSRLLKISTVGTIVAASAPLALPFVKLPFVKEITHGHPEYLIGGAWAVLLSAAIGWVLVRPIVTGAAKGVGVLRLGYLAVLAAALLVTTLLLVNPGALAQHAPGWRGSAGFVLLSASLLSMSMSLARVLRAALFFVMWSFVSIVLASEVFLHKLPQEVVREDLKRLEEVVPKEAIERAIEKLQVTAAPGSSKRTAVVLGGATAIGFPVSTQNTLASRLERFFESSGIAVDVRDASYEGATVFDIAWLAQERVAQLGPDFVFVVGWSADKERGPVAGPLARSDDQSHAAVRALWSSMLMRWVTTPAPPEHPSLQGPRVSPDDYRRELAAAVRTLQQGGSRVVLVGEPVTDGDDRPYREAMVETALETRSLFLPSERIVRQQVDSNKLFSRGVLLSSYGYETLAEGAVNRVRAFSSDL